MVVVASRYLDGRVVVGRHRQHLGLGARGAAYHGHGLRPAAGPRGRGAAPSLPGRARPGELQPRRRPQRVRPRSAAQVPGRRRRRGARRCHHLRRHPRGWARDLELAERRQVVGWWCRCAPPRLLGGGFKDEAAADAAALFVSNAGGAGGGSRAAAAAELAVAASPPLPPHEPWSPRRGF